MLKNKKGIALNEAFGTILTLVLVAILVIVGIVLFANIISGPLASVSAVTTTGESLTPSGNSTDGGTTVSNSTQCSFGSFSLTTATNSTGSLMNSGNYTTTGTGLVRNTTQLVNATDAPWILNYTYTWGSEACTASQGMITQFAAYPALIGLVGTIIFLGIVIGVLVMSFVFGRKEGI